MTAEESLDRQLEDLRALIAAEGLQEDEEVRRHMSLLEIERHAMLHHPPDMSRAIVAQLNELHANRMVERMLTLLQAVLGYYFLPHQPVGQNEPLVGPELGHELKQQLLNDTSDLYDIKNRLHELIAQKGEHE